MWNQKYDLESAETPLYPMMMESPELRWSFIRKVYSIISIQLLATIAVAATVVKVEPISVFFTTTNAGLALYILLIITPLIGKIIPSLSLSFSNNNSNLYVCSSYWLVLDCAVMCPLYYYHQKHPVNYLLLAIFTVSIAFAVGLTCAFTSGN